MRARSSHTQSHHTTHSCQHIRLPDRGSDLPPPWDIAQETEKQLSGRLLLNCPPDLFFQSELLLFQEGTTRESLKQIIPNMCRAAPIWCAPRSTLMYTYTNDSKTGEILHFLVAYHSSIRIPPCRSSCPLTLFPPGLHLLVLEADLSTASNWHFPPQVEKIISVL